MAGRSVSAVLAERELVRLCHSGLDAGELRPLVLGALRRLLPFDAAFFATADPSTLLFTGGHAEDPLGAAQPLFLDNEFGDRDVNRFATLAVSPTHVASLDDATRGDRGSSPRYREIMRPLGLGDELRAALVAGSRCWGYLCLHRTDTPLGFSRAEETTVARVGPLIAHALRQSALLHGARHSGSPQGPGIVLLADDLSVAAITPRAEELLSHVESSGVLPLPMAVYAVAAAVGPGELGEPDPGSPPSTRVLTTDGRWLTVHASRLRERSGKDRTAVVVEPATAGDTVPLMLAAHGLTHRETEVARLVLRGESTRAISNALRLSPHTVQDHLKMVFDKVGVRSRRDLVGRLLGQ